jgi:allantoinase
MIYDLVIQGATVVTTEETRPATVAVQDGTIAAVLDESAVPEARETIDGRGCHLLPGVVDVHVHFREPGQEYKATYASESSAAALGGVTTVCDMANNGALAVVSEERLAAKQAIAGKTSRVDFGTYCYLVAQTEEGARRLMDAGAMGFKWDMSLAGTEVAPGVCLPTPEGAEPYFRAAARVGAVVGIHAEDRPTILARMAALQTAGRNDPLSHLEARPVEAEVIALRQAIALARTTGVRLHVHHLSSAAGLGLVRAAKAEGLAITAETIPAFLFLSADDYETLGPVIKIYPSVKRKEDQTALWEGLRDGSIDCLATDHAPHTREEKLRDMATATAGVIGVQTSLPLMLTAVTEGRITLQRCVEVMCAAPARNYGLAPRKGQIRVGADADLTLVNLSAHGVLRGEDMATPNHLIPYEGWDVVGVPVLTVLRGRVIARDGAIVGVPSGRLVRPTANIDS